MADFSKSLVEVAVIVKRETDKAFCVTVDDKRQVWLPKSQVEWHIDDTKTNSGVMVMPEWLAIDKELV